MSSDEEYLDRLLRSMEDKEAEIDTDVLPDISDVQQNIIMPGDNAPAEAAASVGGEPEIPKAEPVRTSMGLITSLRNQRLITRIWIRARTEKAMLHME